jgi:N-acetylglutamate synthase-like GNAT family acetyltransferase
MLEIRKAKRQDARAIWNIRNAAIMDQCNGHYSADQIRKWTGGKLSEKFKDVVEERFYVAAWNNRVVGTGMIDLKTGKIDAIFVDPGHMKKGVGSGMMAYLEKLARSHGLPELSLESTLNAAPFYRACGFEGEQTGQYKSPRGYTLECVPMIKLLGPGRD